MLTLFSRISLLRYLGLLFIVVVGIIFWQPSSAVALTSEVGVTLPAAQNVKATRDELVAKGCVEPTNINATSGLGGWSTYVTYPDGFVYLVPSDGWKEFDVTIPVLQKGFFNNPNKINLGIFCPYVAVKDLITANKVPAQLSQNEKIIVNILNTFLELIANVGLWLLEVASGFVSFFIPLSSFITNPYVTGGWPFVQGIANLGFLLALLFIAGATTLRIQSFGVTKMLPRLLVAALLINFSLVLAGIFIDLSRVLMAILTNLMGGGINLNTIGMALIKQSSIFQGMLNATGTSIVASGNGSWNIPLKIAEGAVLIYALATGMVLVAVGLIVRYIILIILLIFSPFAYLAFAFPNMEKFAKLWWTQFLTWVFYGPILLFILLLIATLPHGFVPDAAGGDPLEAILGIGITSALLIAGYKFGKSFAGAAGAAAIGFAVGNKRRAVNYAYKNPKTAATIVGGLPGLAAVAVAQRAGRSARDFGRGVSKGVKGRIGKSTVGKVIYGPERNEKGELKPGQSSGGSKLANVFTGALGLASAEIRAAKAAGTNVNSSALSAQNLMKKGVGSSLDIVQRTAILEDGNDATDWTPERTTQRKALVQDKEVVRIMEADEKEKIMRLDVNLPTNLQTNLPPSLANDALNLSNAKENKLNNLKNKTNEALQRSLNQAINNLANEK